MISSNIQSDINPLARQACLKLLGLRQWYSRYDLPNAYTTPVSLQLKPGFVEAASAQLVKNSLAPIQKNASKSSAVDGDRLVLEAVAEELCETDQAGHLGAALSLVNKQNAERAIDLSLCMVFVDGALVIYERESAVNHEVEHAFLRSFLKYAVSSRQGSFESSFLEWPVFSGSVLKAEQLPYFDSVFTRWVCSVDWSSINRIFYFGYHFELLEQSFLDIKISSESECVFVPVQVTLAEILGAPVKKRGLWESISRLSGI